MACASALLRLDWGWEPLRTLFILALSSTPQSNLNKAEAQAIMELKRNKSRIVLTADQE